MLIAMKSLFEVVGEIFPLNTVINNFNDRFGKDCPINTPITVNGMLKNTSGVVSLDVTVSFEFLSSCARCNDVIKQDMTQKFKHIIVTHLDNEFSEEIFDYIIVENELLDLDELILSDISLELPSKVLCQSDCKGMCPVCGNNFNQSDCNCLSNNQGVDPRMAKLLDLLK